MIDIIEWLTNQSDLVDAEIGACVEDTERVLPGVQNPEVVARDGRDQTKDGQNSAVLLQHLGNNQQLGLETVDKLLDSSDTGVLRTPPHQLHALNQVGSEIRDHFLGIGWVRTFQLSIAVLTAQDVGNLAIHSLFDERERGFTQRFQQRHGQEPIDVAVRIIEGFTSPSDFVVADIGANIGNTKRVLLEAEDPDIVVACDSGRDRSLMPHALIMYTPGEGLSGLVQAKGELCTT